ncbi:unnamed protein product [Amoebophrya sp. A120]|nr:unnamed protein product [Amoebophrya sp. A120]|eukprot:GSA120T00020903001.1
MSKQEAAPTSVTEAVLSTKTSNPRSRTLHTSGIRGKSAATAGANGYRVVVRKSKRTGASGKQDTTLFSNGFLHLQTFSKQLLPSRQQSQPACAGSGGSCGGESKEEKAPLSEGSNASKNAPVMGASATISETAGEVVKTCSSSGTAEPAPHPHSEDAGALTVDPDVISLAANKTDGPGLGNRGGQDPVHQNALSDTAEATSDERKVPEPAEHAGTASLSEGAQEQGKAETKVVAKRNQEQEPTQAPAATSLVLSATAADTPPDGDPESIAPPADEQEKKPVGVLPATAPSIATAAQQLHSASFDNYSTAVEETTMPLVSSSEEEDEDEDSADFSPITCRENISSDEDDEDDIVPPRLLDDGGHDDLRDQPEAPSGVALVPCIVSSPAVFSSNTTSPHDQENEEPFNNSARPSARCSFQLAEILDSPSGAGGGRLEQLKFDLDTGKLDADVVFTSAVPLGVNADTLSSAEKQGLQDSPPGDHAEQAKVANGERGAPEDTEEKPTIAGTTPDPVPLAERLARSSSAKRRSECSSGVKVHSFGQQGETPLAARVSTTTHPSASPVEVNKTDVDILPEVKTGGTSASHSTTTTAPPPPPSAPEPATNEPILHMPGYQLTTNNFYSAHGNRNFYGPLLEYDTIVSRTFALPDEVSICCAYVIANLLLLELHQSVHAVPDGFQRLKLLVSLLGGESSREMKRNNDYRNGQLLRGGKNSSSSSPVVLAAGASNKEHQGQEEENGNLQEHSKSTSSGTTQNGASNRFRSENKAVMSTSSTSSAPPTAASTSTTSAACASKPSGSACFYHLRPFIALQLLYRGRELTELLQFVDLASIDRAEYRKLCYYLQKSKTPEDFLTKTGSTGAAVTTTATTTTSSCSPRNEHNSTPRENNKSSRGSSTLNPPIQSGVPSSSASGTTTAAAPARSKLSSTSLTIISGLILDAMHAYLKFCCEVLCQISIQSPKLQNNVLTLSDVMVLVEHQHQAGSVGKKRRKTTIFGGGSQRTSTLSSLSGRKDFATSTTPGVVSLGTILSSGGGVADVDDARATAQAAQELENDLHALSIEEAEQFLAEINAFVSLLASNENCPKVFSGEQEEDLLLPPEEQDGASATGTTASGSSSNLFGNIDPMEACSPRAHISQHVLKAEGKSLGNSHANRNKNSSSSSSLSRAAQTSSSRRRRPGNVDRTPKRKNHKQQSDQIADGDATATSLSKPRNWGRKHAALTFQSTKSQLCKVANILEHAVQLLTVEEERWRVVSSPEMIANDEELVPFHLFIVDENENKENVDKQQLQDQENGANDIATSSKPGSSCLPKTSGISVGTSGSSSSSSSFVPPGARTLPPSTSQGREQPSINTTKKRQTSGSGLCGLGDSRASRGKQEGSGSTSDATTGGTKKKSVFPPNASIIDRLAQQHERFLRQTGRQAAIRSGANSTTRWRDDFSAGREQVHRRGNYRPPGPSTPSVSGLLPTGPRTAVEREVPPPSTSTPTDRFLHRSRIVLLRMFLQLKVEDLERLDKSIKQDVTQLLKTAVSHWGQREALLLQAIRGRRRTDAEILSSSCMTYYFLDSYNSIITSTRMSSNNGGSASSNQEMNRRAAAIMEDLRDGADAGSKCDEDLQQEEHFYPEDEDTISRKYWVSSLLQWHADPKKCVSDPETGQFVSPLQTAERRNMGFLFEEHVVG